MTSFIDTKPPRGMLNRFGKSFYTRHFARLVEDGIVKQSDYDGFLELCQYYGEMRQLRLTIAAEGDTITDRDGNQRKHPGIPRLKDAEAKFLRLSNRFGLNPAARRARKRVAEPLKRANSLDIFHKAQRWLNETFPERMRGESVTVPADVKEFFSW